MCIHHDFCTGLQAAEGFHHSPGSHGVHMQRLLENSPWPKMWGYCHALQAQWRRKGGWAGSHLMAEFFLLFFNAQFQMETKQHLHELSMGNHWESTQSILPHTEFRCDEAKIEESEKAGSCQESNPGHLWPQAWKCWALASPGQYFCYHCVGISAYCYWC